MTQELPCPRITPAFMEWLEAMWPEKSPDITWTLEDTKVKAGQASVVRRIRQEYERQNEFKKG